MDYETTSPAAAMLQNATIDKAEKIDGQDNDVLGLEKSTLTPLTIRDDHIHVPATISLTPPRELLEHILLLLDAKSILTCRLVNREFNEIIQFSIMLQYLLACQAAGVIDNPQSSLSYGERLEALLKRENAWKTLSPVFETTIKVNHRQSGIYALTGGVYFLDDDNERDLHRCHLPSSPKDNPRWITIPHHGPGEDSPGRLLNFAISIHEHDLIINVVSSDIGNQADTQWYSLDLVLLRYSTGEHHPLARHPRIHVQRLPEALVGVIPSIVGDNLALVVHIEGDTFPDKLFIFDWKTGYKILQHETIEDTYLGLVFVSPEILLVPNPIISYFEVWHLPPSLPSPKPPVQILALQIPAISRDYCLMRVSCHGEPKPFLHSIPYFPPRPFFPSPENSIIIANLYMQSRQGTRSDASYTLVMSRRALLETIQKWTSPSFCDQLNEFPMWLTNEVTMDKTADPDEGSVRLDAQSKLIFMKPHPRPPSRAPGSPTTRYSFLHVQWTDWGPSISRWFQVNTRGWTWSSAGQKYAFSTRKYHPHDEPKLMVSVADFNQYNFRRNTEINARLRGDGKKGGANDNNEKGIRKEQVEEELERLDHGGVFSEDVYMGLKCVVSSYHASHEYEFDTVLMDEQRLLGLKLNRFNVESVKVLYFG